MAAGAVEAPGAAVTPVEFVVGLPAGAGAGLVAGLAAGAGLAGGGVELVLAAFARMPRLRTTVRINADELLFRDVQRIFVLIVPSSSF